MTADLEIDVIEGDRSALVDGFLAGTLDPDDLRLFRFRTSPSDAWREHPQLRFIEHRIAPAVLLDGPDLLWQQRVTGSPCGLLHIWHRFSRGWKVESGLGLAESPQVTSTVSYDLVLAVMSGAIAAHGALERGGEVEGEMAAMLQLLDVFAQPEFEAAMRECIGPLGPALRAVAPSHWG